MIEVFKTNVSNSVQAANLVIFLLQHLPGYRINVDLHDCDKVLRVEGGPFAPSRVMMLVRDYGFACTALE